MPRSYRFSPEARLDYARIVLWLCDERPGRDDKFIDALDSTLDKLCLFPELGRKSKWTLGAERVILVWDYYVFYSVDDIHLTVERMFHGARDLKNLLEEED